MVPHHCLSSVWSQQDKSKEHLAPPVQATITQFNSVARCFEDWSVAARDRAREMERRTPVARVCTGGPRVPLQSSRNVSFLGE